MCKANETHRKAFNTRINYVEMTKEFDGEETFPYNFVDLGHYLHDLILNSDSP